MQVDTTRDESAKSEQRRQVEDVRTEHDADADIVLALDERGDGAGDLGRVGRQRRGETEDRLSEMEPRADTLDARDQHRTRRHRRERGDAFVTDVAQRSDRDVA